MKKIQPWQVIALAVTLYLLVVLSSSQWDPMALVRVGSRFDPGDPAGRMGYDGQFAWQIARDPLGGGKYLDKPAYRYQRLLYPLLTWLLSFGQPGLIPWVMPALNILALLLGTWLTERIMREFGVSPWYALVYGLNVGMLMAVRLDLNEPLAFLFFQLGIYLSERNRKTSGAIAFSLAVLSKEVILVLLAGYAIYLFVKSPGVASIRWAMIAVGPFVFLQVGLYLWLGSFGIASGGALATPFELLPLRGWWSLAFYDWNTFLIFSALLIPMAILPAMAGVLISLRELRAGLTHPAVLILLAQSLLIFFLPSSNLLDPLGLSRITIGLIVAFLLFGGYKRSRRILVYTQLWMATIVFIWGDSFLPVS